MPKKDYSYGKQFIDDDDLKSIQSVLNSNYLTQGPVTEDFENNIANFVGSKHAVSVNSATSGLHIACLSLGLSSQDILWTSPISFVASANCGLYCGADIDFVDIEKDSFNICPKALSKKLSTAKANSRLPKILVVVHMCGNPANLEKIKSVCDLYGVKIIEDASHALGASYKDSRIGDCKYSEAAIFSFHPVKMITTAEGGMVTTNSQDLYNLMITLRSHGITRDRSSMLQYHGPWYYEQKILGFNYRMNEIQAALGISQLRKLEGFLVKRNDIARKYREFLNQEIFSYQHISTNSTCSYHLFVCQFREKKTPLEMASFFNDCLNASIRLNIHYIPIHLQPFYKNLGKFSDLRESESYYPRSFSIPIYFQLCDEDLIYITKSLNKIAHNYL